MVKDLISNIVKALIDQPDQVSVTEVEGRHTVVLELSVAKRWGRSLVNGAGMLRQSGLY